MDELARFDQDVLAALRESRFMPVLYGLLALSRIGERPVPLEKLAALLDRSEEHAARLVHQHTTARVQDRMIQWDMPFPADRARRTLYVGDRVIPMNRCVSATFVLAAVLDVAFRLEEPCAATGAPIRIDFVPGGYELVDPPETVIAVPPARRPRRDLWNDTGWKDDNVCVHGVAFGSGDVARGWLADHPGGRVFTVDEMFDRPWITYYRQTLRRTRRTDRLATSRTEHR
ncbi:MAG TPA: organomercurial lyase [Pseudonocardiaceae bacterium]|nr:organomercurial lyase [Pseudonocardiaceae bacterium]